MHRKKRFWIVPFLAVCTAVLPVLADDDDYGERRRGGDHEIARGALERGEIVPLDDVLAEVRKTIAGQIVRIKLERKHGRWLYELRVLGPDGSIMEVYVDARTKAIVKVKEK